MNKNKQTGEAKHNKIVGAFVGKFLPPHIGHISVIDRALKECDEVIVVISDSAKKSKQLCDDNNFPYFSAKIRLNWLKNYYKNEKNIKFCRIDESKLNSKYFDGEKYAELFWKSVKQKVDKKYADESYRELNEKHFPECEFVSIDREKTPVHSSDIRTRKAGISFAIKTAQADILKALKKQNKITKKQGEYNG